MYLMIFYYIFLNIGNRTVWASAPVTSRGNEEEWMAKSRWGESHKSIILFKYIYINTPDRHWNAIDSESTKSHFYSFMNRYYFIIPNSMPKIVMIPCDADIETSSSRWFLSRYKTYSIICSIITLTYQDDNDNDFKL